MEAERPQDRDAPLLAPPPPHRNCLESHALDREGREKYLRSLGELRSLALVFPIKLASFQLSVYEFASRVEVEPPRGKGETANVQGHHVCPLRGTRRSPERSRDARRECHVVRERICRPGCRDRRKGSRLLWPVYPLLHQKKRIRKTRAVRIGQA